MIIEEELLDPSHFWDKRYVKITTEQIMSELDETVLRYFEREINAWMAEFLEHDRDAENRYFRKLLKEYYPQARRILRDQYRDLYPRAWKKKFTMDDLKKVSWDGMAEDVSKRIHLLGSLSLVAEGTPLMDKIVEDLILPNLRLLAEFCENVEIKEEP